MSWCRPVASTASSVGWSSRKVVAVGAVGGPADRDAVAIRGDGPLPAALVAVGRVRPGALAAVGSLVQRAVEGHVVEVEADDPVECGERRVLELVEHPGIDPLVASGSQGRVGDLVVEDRFDVHPRRPGHEPDEQTPQAQPVRDPRPMAAEPVRPIRRWKQRLDRCPDGIEHLGLERAHDVGDLHLVVGLWYAPGINTGPRQRQVDGQLSASRAAPLNGQLKGPHWLISRTRNSSSRR